MNFERYYDIKLPDGGGLEDGNQDPNRYQRAHKRRFLVNFMLKAASLIGAAIFLTLLVSKLFGLIKEGRDSSDYENNWPRPNCCHNIESTRSFDFDFDNLDHFELIEQINHSRDAATEPGSVESDRNLDHRRGFFGLIQILPAPADQTQDVRVTVSINATNAFLAEHVDHKSTSSSLSLSLPSPWTSDSSKEGYLFVNISLYARPGLTLENLVVKADASTVVIPMEIDLAVNTTTIHLKAGKLAANPFFNSRETRIEVGAGSVTGKYGLYDLLSIITNAGSIKATVIPKPVDEENPAPARLHASTHFGSIKIDYPPLGTKIPDREYETAVCTERGSIHGRYLHGKTTTIRTHSGSITASILPYGVEFGNSTINTSTGAGSQNIELLPPYRHAGTPIGNLSSTHITGAASVRLKYPPEWEGLIQGETQVGSLSLSGKDVVIIEEGGRGPVGHFVKAEKGHGDSELVFHTGVGSASVVVG